MEVVSNRLHGDKRRCNDTAAAAALQKHHDEMTANSFDVSTWLTRGDGVASLAGNEGYRTQYVLVPYSYLCSATTW